MKRVFLIVLDSVGIGDFLMLQAITMKAATH